MFALFTLPQSRGAALEVLRALVKEGGARVDVRDADGRTPLLWAASAGSAAAVLALHQAGAKVDDADRYLIFNSRLVSA